MAASRCWSSALKLSQLTRNSLYLVPQRQLSSQFSLRKLSLVSSTARQFPQFPRLAPFSTSSQVPPTNQSDSSQTENASQQPKPGILSSMKGLGIAEDVMKTKLSSEKSQDDEKKDEKSQADQDEEARKKAAEKSWKTMKYSLIFTCVTLSGFAGFFLVVWGAPEKDEEGKEIVDEFSNKPLPLQYLLRAWKEVNLYEKMIKDPSRDKLLPDPLKEPYYQPPYTLILEMTDVLVHPDWTYQTGWRFKKRPGVGYFISQVGYPTFEVVVYTKEQPFTAFPIIDALDPQQGITYRLFRDATRYVEGQHVKDLDCINRDLSKVIVVDWNEKSVQYHPRNLLKIKRWTGNDDDKTLYDLAVLLKTIATSGVTDVREVLDFYRQFEDPVEAFKENQRRLEEQQELMERMQKEKQTSSPTSLARGLFGRRF